MSETRIDGAFTRAAAHVDEVRDAESTTAAQPRHELGASSNSSAPWKAEAVAHPQPEVAAGGLNLLLSSLFGGNRTSPKEAAAFDFGAILGKIFEALSGKAPAPAGTKSGLTDTTAAVAPKAQTSSSPDTARVAVEENAHVEGQTTVGDTTISGAANAHAGASATATGKTWAGLNGVGASGSVEARAGVSADAAGSIKSSWGSISGSVGVSAEVYARASGYVQANTKGATAAGEAEVGAHVEAHAKADADIAGGLVSGHAEANAEAGAGAKADAKAAISYDPLTAAVDASAGAFAGARASFSAKGGVAGVSYGISGEAWAGVGAKAELHAGIEDGKFKFSLGIGVALGIGGFLKIDFEIDLKPIGKFFANLFGGGKDTGAKAADVLSGVLDKASPDTVAGLKDLNTKFDQTISTGDDTTSRSVEERFANTKVTKRVQTETKLA